MEPLINNSYNKSLIKWFFIIKNLFVHIIAIKDIYIDLSNKGASTEIIAILNVTTDAAKSKPDRSPINVPKEIMELNKNLNVCKILSAFLAKDKNKTETTPSKIPNINGTENTAFKIIISRKAINITSVFEKAIPVAKLL